MSKSRYRPRQPSPLDCARIDIRQERYEGAWYIYLTEPCDDWHTAKRAKLGQFDTADEAQAAAAAMKRVPPDMIFVSGPIHNMGSWP